MAVSASDAVSANDAVSASDTGVHRHELDAGSKAVAVVPQFSSKDVIKLFYVALGEVAIVNEADGIKVYLVQGKKATPIPRAEIDGVPDECFEDSQKMGMFLSECYAQVTEFSDHSGFKLRVHVSGVGAGNMMAVGKKWPVQGEGEHAKIVIPYTLTGSKTAVEADKTLNSARKSKKQDKLKKDLRAGKDPKLSAELEALDSIRQAIEEWNETPVVELIDVQDYKKKYGSAPKRWIGFETRNEEGICEAPCIGMCPQKGEVRITCDIENRFHSDPVQSMMHEIGHVIGLRHEHARVDRDSFVSTNLDEEMDGIRSGPYDYDSIMHYAFGRYGQEHLYLDKDAQKAFSVKEVKRLLKEVGTAPRISSGDIATIRELYRAEFSEKIRIQQLTASFAAASLAEASAGGSSAETEVKRVADGRRAYEQQLQFLGQMSTAPAAPSSSRDLGVRPLPLPPPAFQSVPQGPSFLRVPAEVERHVGFVNSLSQFERFQRDRNALVEKELARGARYNLEGVKPWGGGPS